MVGSTSVCPPESRQLKSGLSATVVTGGEDKTQHVCVPLLIHFQSPSKKIFVFTPWVFKALEQSEIFFNITSRVQPHTVSGAAYFLRKTHERKCLLDVWHQTASTYVGAGC